MGDGRILQFILYLGNCLQDIQRMLQYIRLDAGFRQLFQIIIHFLHDPPHLF